MGQVVGVKDLPDPEQSAEDAGLHYVTGEGPGLSRARRGRGFTYFDAAGKRITEVSARRRIEALVIPPAWSDVWICPSPHGHIQATGRDERGRKQYIYHPDWERVRNETKFNRMIPFAEALPELRARCDVDLGRRKLDREKVLATVVVLLDRTLIRVGNVEYAKQNRSFGLTTLRDRHVAFEGAACTFAFQGKSGKKHTIELSDRRLARIVRRCRDIPGYELFQYYDDDGARCAVDSAAVNAYLREITGADFTAKDFRTWGGTVNAALVLVDLGAPRSATDARKKLAEAARQVGERLGNTATVSRNYYIHPALITAFESGTLHRSWPHLREDAPADGLEPEEHALLSLLKEMNSSETS